MPLLSNELSDIAFRDTQGDMVPLIDARGGPVIVVLAQDRLAREAAAAGDALCAELRGLGASLVLGDGDGYWRIRPDDPIDGLAQDPGDRFERFAVATDAPAPWLAVLVLDATGTVQYRHVERDAPAAPGVSAIAIVQGALRAAGRALRARRAEPLRAVTRRDLILGSIVTGFGLALTSACRIRSPAPARVRSPASDAPEDAIDVTLDINGRAHTLAIEPRVTLLDALRERLGLTGTKKGCDHGQCGACTVLVDGRATLSCLTLAVMHGGVRITTIEGLARGDQLHPMQAAFLHHDAYQCGYCTPGQILSAVALVAARRGETDDDIREHMSGNLCRCGAYPNIVAAVRQVHGAARGR
jgi:xanthine dehydrogenase YagT iron-sulfur-binding subunit